MSQNFSYPSSGSITIQGIGPTNVAVPSYAFFTGGEDPSGKLQGLQLDSSLNLKTVISNTNLTIDLNKVGGTAISLGQKLMAASIPIVIASDQSTLNTQLQTGSNVIGSISNTSFAATQSGTWNIGSITTLPSLPSGSNAIGSITNTSFEATQATAANLNATVIGTGTFAVQAAQSGTWNIGSITTLPSLPSGSNTIGAISNTSFDAVQSGTWNIGSITTLPSLAAGSNAIGSITNTSFEATQSTAANLNATVVGTGTFAVQSTEQGLSLANAPVYNDYTGTSISTSAYVQLIASTTAATKEIEIFDSSGQALYLAIGGAGSEVNQMIIFPGGNGRVKLTIPASSRVSAKAITGTANVGFLAINLYA